MNEMKLVREGENQVRVTRRFDASPKAVYLAHITPELLQKWCTGPEGWTMPKCICDAKAGGEIRYEWVHPEQGSFHLTGHFVELVPHSKIVHVERMHLPDPTPDNHVVTTFEPEGEGTLLNMLMNLPSHEIREAMLATGMEGGMSESYVRLEDELEATNRVKS